MLSIIEIFLIISVLAFIGFPIFRSKSEADLLALHTGDDQIKEGLIQKKEFTYMSLRDLDLDFRTGKVSEEDYNKMKAKYEHEAIEVLKQLDHIGDKKKAKSTSAEKTPFLKNKKEIFCTKCGHKASKSDKFCSICGHSLI